MAKCIICTEYFEGSGEYCSYKCRDYANEKIRRQEETNNKLDQQNYLLQEQIANQQKVQNEKEYFSRECPNCTRKTERSSKYCTYCEHKFTDFDNELKKLKEEKIIAEKLSVSLLVAKNKWHKEFDNKSKSSGVSLEICVDNYLKEKKEKENQLAKKKKHKRTLKSITNKTKATFKILYRILIIGSLALFLYNYFNPNMHLIAESYSFIQSNIYVILIFMVIAGISGSIAGDFINHYNNSKLTNAIIGAIGSALGLPIYYLFMKGNEDNIIYLLVCTIICSIVIFLSYKLIVRYWRIFLLLMLACIYLIYKESIEVEIMDLSENIYQFILIITIGISMSLIEYYVEYEFDFLLIFGTLVIGLSGTILGYLFLVDSIDVSAPFIRSLLASYLGCCIILTLDKLMLKIKTH